MNRQQIGECWLYCVKMMCGIGWDFTQDGLPIGAAGLRAVEPSLADRVQRYVDGFQHTWHINQAAFFYRIYPGVIEQMAVLPDDWSKPRQLGMGFLPLLRGALLEAATIDGGLARLGGSLIEVGTPEPLMFCPPALKPMHRYESYKLPVRAFGQSRPEWWPTTLTPPGDEWGTLEIDRG